MTEIITPGQCRQIFRFCEDALSGLKISKDEAQRVIETGGKFQNDLLRLIHKLARLSAFAGEEVESELGYPEGFRIRSVQEQAKALLALEPFRNLDASHVDELASGDLPDGAEGWAVLPNPLEVAENYHQALGVALDLIAASRQFQNWRKGELTEKHLRLREKTAKAHAKLNEQPGDFWVVPLQFGLKYGGKSVRRARVLFTENEFGLGAYEVAVLLLTHPDRITGQREFYVDCAGVEYAPSADGVFFACLRFYWGFNYERLELNYNRAVSADKQWGAGSAFLA